MTEVVLASTSASRRALLQGAGVPFTARSPGVDEDAAKAALLGEGLGPRDVADALAELKAVRVNAGRAGGEAHAGALQQRLARGAGGGEDHLGHAMISAT